LHLAAIRSGLPEYLMNEILKSSCGVLHEKQRTIILRICSDSVRGSPVASFGEKASHLPRPLNLLGLGLYVNAELRGRRQHRAQDFQAKSG
jgi:hypothetical protein